MRRIRWMTAVTAALMAALVAAPAAAAEPATRDAEAAPDPAEPSALDAGAALLARGPFARPGAPGVGDAYFPLAGNGGYDVAHYALELAYDPASAMLEGTATISATATQPLTAGAPASPARARSSWSAHVRGCAAARPSPSS